MIYNPPQQNELITINVKVQTEVRQKWSPKLYLEIYSNGVNQCKEACGR